MSAIYQYKKDKKNWKQGCSGNQVRAWGQAKGVVLTPKTPHTADRYLCKFLQALKLDSVLCWLSLSITNVVKPALVVLTMMARCLLATTTRKL